MADEATQPDQQPVEPAPVAAPVADPTQAPADAPSPSPEATTAGASPQPQAAPVTVDHSTRRDDNDALEGHFAKVVDGEHAGQTGVFSQVLEYDPQTGYPALVLIDFRDANYTYAQAPVRYGSIRPAAPYLGGR